MSYQPRQGQRPGYYAAIKKSQGQQQQQNFGGSASSAAAAAPARGPGAKRIIWFSVKEVVWPPEYTTVFYDIRSQKMREAAGDRALHGHEFKPCLPEEDGFLHQRHRHDLHTVRNEATGKEVIAEGGDDEDEDETDESDSTADGGGDDQQMSKDDDDETGDTDSQRTQRVNFDRSQLEESILNGTSEIVAKVQQYTHDEEKGHNHFEIIEKSEKFVMMQGIPSIDPYFIYQAEVQDTTKKHPHRDINMLQLLDMRMQPLTYAKGHISNFKHMLHVELQLSPSFTQQLAQQVENLAIIKEEERRVELQQQRDREDREEREEEERRRKDQEEARAAAAAKAAASKAAAQQQQQKQQQQKQSGNIFAKGGRGAQQPPVQQQSRITFFAEKKQKPAAIVNERLIRDEYIKEALPSEIYKELRNRTYYYMYQELQNVLQECTGGCIRVNNKRFFLQANMHAIEELRRKLRWEPWMIIVPDVRQSFHLQPLSYADYDDLRRHYQTLRLSDLPEMARNEGLDKMRYPRAWPQNMLYVMLLYHLLEKPAKCATGDMFTTMETLVSALREHVTKGRGNKQRQDDIRRFQSADINQPGADLAAYCGKPWVWSFDKFRTQHGQLYKHLVQALCWVTKRRRDIVLVRDISDSPLAEKLVRDGSLSFYLGYDGDDGSDGGDFISQDDEDEEGGSSSNERTLTPNECSSTMRIYRSSVWKKQTRIVTFLRSHAKEMLAKMPKYSAHRSYAEIVHKTLTRMRTGVEPTTPLYTDDQWKKFDIFPEADIIQMMLAERMAEQQQDIDVEDIMQREEGSNLFRHEAVQVYIKPHEHIDWKSMLMERLGGICLNTEQSVAMDMLLDPSKGVCVINGPPGSGKTLLIQALFIAMDRPFGNGLFLTLGGRLSQQHNERMRTLHKYMNETEASKGPVVRDMNLMALTIHMARAIFRAGGKVFNRFVAMVKSLNVLVLDEAQNEDIDLVCMIIHLAMQSPVLQKIVFVGDPNQIPPYGIGNPFWGIIEWAKQKGVDSYFKLEENNRVSNISKDDPRMQLVEDTRILVNETVSTHIDNTLKGFPFTADQMRELRENPHAGSNMVIKKMRYKAIHSDELTPEEKQQQELQQWENNILPSQRTSRAPLTLDLRTAYEPPRDSVIFVTRSDFEKMCSYILRVYKMHKSIYKDINILTGNKDTIFRINRWLGHKLRDEVAFQSGDRYNRGTATQQYAPYLHEKSYITVGTKICMRKNIRRAIVPIRKVLLDKFNMYRKQRRQDREKKQQQSKHGGEEEESAEEEEPQRNSPFQSDVFARLQAALQWGEAQGNENDNGNRQTVQDIMSKHFNAEEDVDYIITAAVTNGELDWIQEIRHDVGDPELNLQVVKLLQSQKTIVVGPQHVPERHIVPGYVTTVDSQMGSECKICVLVLDGRRNISWLDRARVVVGFTRAIEKLYVLAEEWNVPAWQLQSKLKSREDLGGRPRYNVDKITKLTDAEVNQLNNRMWRDRDDAKKHNNLQSFLEERYDSILRNGEDFRDEIITLNAIMIFQLLYTNPTRQRLSDLARHLRDGIEEPPPAASLLAARNAARQAAEQREEQDELMRQAVTPTSSDEELMPSKAAAAVVMEEEEENVMQDDDEEEQPPPPPPSHKSTSLFSRLMRRGKKRSRPSIEEEEEEEKSHRSQPSSSSGDDSSSESSDEEENDDNQHQPPAKKQHTAPLLLDEEEEE